MRALWAPPIEPQTKKPLRFWHKGLISCLIRQSEKSRLSIANIFLLHINSPPFRWPDTQNLMRLNNDQIQAIRQAATIAFGQGTSVWLFGSRADDAKKGGDIDLLVCPQVRPAEDAAEPQQAFMQKIKMLNLLERYLGERKIDIVVEQAQDTRPIVEVAHKTGIKLQ
jgi:predicted nucleotidyltransferase